MPDDLRKALVLDIREMMVLHPHSAQGRRQFLRERYEAGAPWAKVFVTRCFTELEEQAEKTWTQGERIVEKERRERENLDREAEKKATVCGGELPGQRTQEPPSVDLDDESSPPPVLRFTERQAMPLIQQKSRQRMLDILDGKAAAVKQRDYQSARVKEMVRAEKGHRGAIELAQAIAAAWDQDPEALSYEQVMRGAGLTFRQFGISTKFFADQVSDVSGDGLDGEPAFP
ncbi:hypothetical protein [Streptomyces sp. TLI_171]|uniref:hypothetical protein n=1 Tax=Streptomyces sp. TLI_171 TaxID=1938859 RepID=UPI000C19EDF8|nr:hypothetical protein [Streptomyces sp. TLI_171]RKE02962.1 hypothetical protein BX266_7566 [Streptomyces sp. TLI_171]